MQNKEIISYVKNEIKKLRAEGYAKAQDLLKVESQVRRAIELSAENYQLEVSAYYDDKRAGDIRVVVAVYVDKNKQHPHWWQFWKNIESPVYSEDFIINSKGGFIGE